MKYLVVVLSLLSVNAFAQTYNTDVADIFAGENQVEDSLNMANEILCIISKLRAEQYIDKGPYKANVYPERCRKQAIQTGSSRQSGSSSGSGQQNQQQQNQVELPSTMIVDVEYKEPQADGTTSIPEHIEVKSWFFQKGDYSEAQTNYDNLWDAQPDMLIYALTKVYAGASESDPNGDMELNYLITTNCQNAPYASLEDAQNAASQAGYDSISWEYFQETEKFTKCPPAGTVQGSGYLSTMGNSIAFQELGVANSSGDMASATTTAGGATTMSAQGGDGYGGGSSNSEIIISQNSQTIGGETVFTRDGLWEEEKSYCIVDQAGIKQVRDSYDCNFQEYNNQLGGTTQVQVLVEKILWEGKLTNGFSFDDTSKKFCQKLISARKKQSDGTYVDDTDTIINADWSYFGGYGVPDLTEKCKSTDKDLAKISVWEYGLYNQDGSRYNLKNPGFELEGPEITNEDGLLGAPYAWADYWGVWLDYDYQNIVTDTTPFTKVNSDDASNYYLKPKSVSIRKISVEKKSLNDLDGVEIELYVEWDIKETGSECWWNNYVVGYEGTTPILDSKDTNSNGDDDRCMKERWSSLGVPTTGTYVVFKGYWDASYALNGTTPVGAFVFNSAIRTNDYGWWVGEDDITEFAFTPQQYIEAMDDNLDSSDGYQVWRTLWASGGNYGGYEITTAAMQDPASLSVEFRKESEASLEDLASLTLGCIQNCYSSRSFNAYLSDAIAKIDTANRNNTTVSGKSPSPLTSPGIEASTSTVPTGNYLRTNQGGRTAGDWTSDGVLETELMQYKFVNGSIQDTITNADIAFPNTIYEYSDPWSAFQNVCYYEPNGSGEICGLYPQMRLFNMAKLDQMECDKTEDSNGDGIKDSYGFHDDDTVQSAPSSTKRYCVDKLQAADEYYDLYWDTWKSYQVFDSNDQLVEISRPHTVTFKIPNDASKYGKLADKKKTLEYSGFGQLWGFEWSAFDIATWTEKGEYWDYNEGGWENIRWFPEYTIPDGSEVIGDDGTAYKSKIIRGEFFLKPADESIGTLAYSTSPTALDELSGTPITANDVGTVPTNAEMLNAGKPSVDHGVILFEAP